jgi:hypothetical protein
MQVIRFAVPAFLLAGCSVAHVDGRSLGPVEPGAQVPSVVFNSAFDGYRSFADQELQDWRKANEEVGAAGGHRGHRPGKTPQ